MPLRTHRLALLFCVTLLFPACRHDWESGSDVPPPPPADGMRWFPRPDPAILQQMPHVIYIPGMAAWQQTTEYTCGPASLLTLVLHHGTPGYTASAASELQIAREAGCGMGTGPERPGTSPDRMAAWLRDHGYTVSLTYESAGDGSQLDSLRANLRRGIPTLVEWTDLMGHWVVAVGYDNRNDVNPWNDVLILADPYDKYDDVQDGFTFVNANKFYWLWWDQFNFDTPVWRTMITAVPE